MNTENLFLKKERGEEEIFILNEKHERYKSLKELVFELHYGCMPNDSIFEICAHFVGNLSEYETREDFEDADLPVTVYTGEVRKLFQDMDHVLESAWNDLSDYVNIDSGYSPYEYQEKCIWGYSRLVQYRVAQWAEENGVWGEIE